MALFGIGAALRDERIRQQRTVDEIARVTRIPQKFLTAIEAENFDILPSLVFTRNFIRQYASTLNIDPEPILASIPKVDISTVPLPDPPSRVRQSTWDPHWTSVWSTAAWCVLAVGAAGGAYWYFNHPRATLALNTPAVASQRPQPQVPQETPPPATNPEDAPADATPTGAAPADAPAADASVPVATERLAAQPAPVPGPEPEQGSHPVQVVLTARQTAWVEITSDGKRAFSGTLQQNESRSVGADTLVKVQTGNAGGLQISLNGKELDPIGTAGQIRTVRLTAEGLQREVKSPPVPTAPL